MDSTKNNHIEEKERLYTVTVTMNTTNNNENIEGIEKYVRTTFTEVAQNKVTRHNEAAYKKEVESQVDSFLSQLEELLDDYSDIYGKKAPYRWLSTLVHNYESTGFITSFFIHLGLYPKDFTFEENMNLLCALRTESLYPLGAINYEKRVVLEGIFAACKHVPTAFAFVVDELTRSGAVKFVDYTGENMAYRLHNFYASLPMNVDVPFSLVVRMSMGDNMEFADYKVTDKNIRQECDKLISFKNTVYGDLMK